jgi:hypothetical protein
MVNDRGDLHLSGEHPDVPPLNLERPVEVPLTLGSGGDTIGTATLNPDGTMSATVYEPNLSARLTAAGAGSRHFSVGAGAVSLEDGRLDDGR